MRTVLVMALVLALVAPSQAAKRPTAKPPAAKPLPEGTSDIQRQCVDELRRELEGRAQVAAAKALAELGDADAMELLRGAIRRNPGDPYAYAALVWLGDDPYVQAALDAMRDPEAPPFVLTTYGAAFVRRPNDEVKKRLSVVWGDGTVDPIERLWAAVGLYEMGDATPQPYLERILAEPDPYASVVAAGALLSRGHAKARETLLTALRDKKSELWDHAAVSFGEYPDTDVLPLLRKALAAAKAPEDRVWLAWAVLRTTGFRF